MQWFRAFVRSWWYHDELSFVALFALVTSSFRTRVALQAEILALRHQLAVFQKNAPRRLRLRRSDRRPRKPPSQTWRTCLTNHMEQMASIDFFVVPTATFRVLFVFVVLSNARRRVLHFQVTEHPSQEWTMQQMREAFPWDQPCRYLLRDRDAIYGGDWVAMTKGLGMEEVISAPRSPWQNPYVERLIGSIRRECLDHIIVWNERSSRRTLKDYFAYYQRSRTHLALAKDAPESRVVEKPESGCIVAIPQLGGLHHRYQRHAA